jgi:hypothetical protein
VRAEWQRERMLGPECTPVESPGHHTSLSTHRIGDAGGKGTLRQAAASSAGACRGQMHIMKEWRLPLHTTELLNAMIQATPTTFARVGLKSRRPVPLCSTSGQHATSLLPAAAALPRPVLQLLPARHRHAGMSSSSVRCCRLQCRVLQEHGQHTSPQLRPHLGLPCWLARTLRLHEPAR